MATAEIETLSDIHIWEAQGDVPTDHGMLDPFREVFEQCYGEGRAHRGSRIDCQVYNRRNRNLRFRNRNERAVRRR